MVQCLIVSFTLLLLLLNLEGGFGKFMVAHGYLMFHHYLWYSLMASY
jgi:hypothetical protein